jgi:hypothetical protein
MPSFGTVQGQSGPETYRARNEDLSNNPHIAAAWLKKRFEIFFEEVIKKKFKPYRTTSCSFTIIISYFYKIFDINLQRNYCKTKQAKQLDFCVFTSDSMCIKQ